MQKQINLLHTRSHSPFQDHFSHLTTLAVTIFSDWDASTCASETSKQNKLKLLSLINL